MHFGFLDPKASLGRQYASLGLAIDGFDTEIVTSSSGLSEVFGDCCNPEIKKTTLSMIEKLQSHFRLNKGLAVELRSIPPRHSGFGTGTQLGLSLAKSFCVHYNFPFSSIELSRIIGRGNRSGIGTAAFENGGFLIDGGKGVEGLMPPLLFKKNFPVSWKILLILDHSKKGLHGDAEKNAIKRLPVFEKQLSSHLCHETLLRILPSVIEKDFSSFVIGLNEIQGVMGNYFSVVQGGSKFSSLKVKTVMSWLEKKYNVAIGQSSWGPTGFVFFENEETLSTALKQIKKEGMINGSLQAVVTRASNVGASVKKIKDI